ncbi:MAG TPA: FAD:protein FMN transferase [Thermoanaerobaculia bacterium]
MLPFLFALLVGVAPSAPAPAQAFGQPVEIQIRGLPEEATREAVQKAMAGIAGMERLIDTGSAGLSAAAGKGPRPVDPRLFDLLTRAWSFCQWSEGAHGPLGRDLYALWGLRSRPEDPPGADAVLQATKAAACDQLTLDPQKKTATLAAGSGVDPVGFAEGAAVDRAVEILRESKVSNAFVRVGPVRRAFGPGPAGKGWPVFLPQVPGMAEPADLVYLRDQSLAVAASSDHPLLSETSSYLNQRTGAPAQGVLATVAVTELAVDAQGLAATMLILGPREGELRMGTLRPRPSLLWFLGSGEGAPLIVNYRWLEFTRR